jgi:hypothetical protein
VTIGWQYLVTRWAARLAALDLRQIQVDPELRRPWTSLGTTLSERSESKGRRVGRRGRGRPPHAWPLFAAVLLGQTSAAWAQTSNAGDTQGAAVGSPLKIAVSTWSALESATVADAPPEQGRVNVGLGYGHATRRSRFEFSMGSAVPYSNGISRDLVSYAGGLSFSTRFGRRIVLDVTESLSERPLDSTGISGYSPGVRGAVSDALTTNGGLGAARETRNDGEVTLSRTLSRRSTASVSFTHTSSRSAGLAPAGSQLASVRLERRLSPSAMFHAGYGFGSASFATADAAAGVRHDVDFGFDFARPLPFSGRTVLETETGSTILSDGRSRRLRLVLRGSLSRDLAPRWSSRIEYSRPMQFVAGFRQPFLSDALGLNLDGQIGRAWFVLISGGFALGSVGFNSAGASQYDSYTTSVRVRREIGRAWHVEAEGFATRFRFMGGEPVGVSLPSRLQRQGVRAGLSWSAALFRRG